MKSQVSWRRILIVVGAIAVPAAALLAVIAARESQEAAWGITLLVMFGLPVGLLTALLRRLWKNREKPVMTRDSVPLRSHGTTNLDKP